MTAPMTTPPPRPAGHRRRPVRPPRCSRRPAAVPGGAARRRARSSTLSPLRRLYAMARYEQVHAALVDWQRFQLGAGVGLSNFRTRGAVASAVACCWRPTRRTTTRRAGCSPRILGPRALRRLRERWCAGAERARRRPAGGCGPPEFDAVPALAEAFPLRVFPDAVGIPERGTREPAALRRPSCSTRSARTTTWCETGAPRVGRAVGVGRTRSACARCSPTTGSAPQIWAAADRGDITPEQAPLVVRSLLSAGVDTTVHGLGAVLYAFATHPEPVATGCASDPHAGAGRVRRGGALGVAGADVLPHGRRIDVRVGDAVVPEGAEDPHVPRVGQPRPAALGRPRRLRPLPRPLRPRRLRHGHPPVRRPARRPARGRGAADRAGRPGRAIELAGPSPCATTTTRCAHSRRCRCGYTSQACDD